MYFIHSSEVKTEPVRKTEERNNIENPTRRMNGGSVLFKKRNNGMKNFGNPTPLQKERKEESEELKNI